MRGIALEFGDKVRHLRELRGLSTYALAERCGLSQSFISEIENYKRKAPRVSTIRKLAKALGIPQEYFLDEEGATPFELLPNMPEELKKLLLSERAIPYLSVTAEAMKRGVPPEKWLRLLEAAYGLTERAPRSESEDLQDTGPQERQ